MIDIDHFFDDIEIKLHLLHLGLQLVQLHAVGNTTATAERRSLPERRTSPVVRTLAYHAARPGSIPGLGDENY